MLLLPSIGHRNLEVERVRAGEPSSWTDYIGLDPHRSSSKLHFARMRSLGARNGVEIVALGFKLI